MLHRFLTVLLQLGGHQGVVLLHKLPVFGIHAEQGPQQRHGLLQPARLLERNELVEQGVDGALLATVLQVLAASDVVLHFAEETVPRFDMGGEFIPAAAVGQFLALFRPLVDLPR